MRSEQPVHKLYNVGTYIRLSREDKRADESVSVENQRTMLSQFISHMPNWIETRTYVDDGVSGSNFNRKGFQDMMTDVRRGVINLVLVKDLSRFGRNYLEAGRYLEEELPAFGCRFVALADNIDTETGENDIIPFLNAINDFYLRDISERIKSVIKAKAQDGQKVAGAAPYGYVRKPNECSRLAVDDIAAKVVRRIFDMRASGTGFTAIAGILTKEGILSPRAYYFERQGRKINAAHNTTSSCAKIWSTRTVKLLLGNEIYIGNTVSLKRGTRSYRDNREYKRDENEWIRVENTHIPIVETEIWDKVQEINRIAKAKMENCKPPRPNLFSGLLICPDCGTKMNRIKRTYYCSTNQRSGGVACSPHNIMEIDLKSIVLSHIKELAEKIALNEDAMLERLRSKLVDGCRVTKSDRVKQRQILEQQLHVLELQIDQLYNDKVEGSISAETFTALVGNIETKREQVEQALYTLTRTTQVVDAKLDDIDRWATLIKEKATFIDVDRELLEALVEKIEVGEKSVTEDGQEYQTVQICYKFVGIC